MAGGEHAGENHLSADEVAERTAMVPGQPEFDAVGQHGAFRVGFENVMMTPERERAADSGVDEESGRADRFPDAGPAKGERAAAYRHLEPVAGLRGRPGLDPENVESVGRDAAEVVRVLVEIEQLRGRGFNKGGAGENRHVSREARRACRRDVFFVIAMSPVRQ